MSVDTEGDSGQSFHHLEDGQREGNQKRSRRDGRGGRKKSKGVWCLEQGVAPTITKVPFSANTLRFLLLSAFHFPFVIAQAGKSRNLDFCPPLERGPRLYTVTNYLLITVDTATIPLYYFLLFYYFLCIWESWLQPFTQIAHAPSLLHQLPYFPPTFLQWPPSHLHPMSLFTSSGLSAGSSQGLVVSPLPFAMYLIPNLALYLGVIDSCLAIVYLL